MAARIRRGLMFAALAFGATSFAAQERGENDMRLLESFLADVTTFRAEFEQSLVDSVGELLESSSGMLVIRRPGQFRWSYETPYAQELVADGLNIWSYDVDLEQVTVKAQADMLANTPATLLGGDRSALAEFEFIGSEIDERGTSWLTLSPQDAGNGFDRVELGFDEGVLRRMVFTDSLGQTTLIALVAVQLNEPVADETFEFSVPDGADLIGVPLTAHRADDPDL